MRLAVGRISIQPVSDPKGQFYENNMKYKSFASTPSTLVGRYLLHSSHCLPRPPQPGRPPGGGRHTVFFLQPRAPTALSATHSAHHHSDTAHSYHCAHTRPHWVPTTAAVTAVAAQLTLRATHHYSVSITSTWACSRRGSAVAGTTTSSCTLER